MDEDAKRVHNLHDDVIVITLLIVDYTTRRVLVDNKSSIDILYYPAFQQRRRMRSTLSSKFTLGRIWRDENAAHGHYYVTCGGKSNHNK